MTNLTQHLEAEAKAKGVSLRDVARKAGVNQVTVTRWRNGSPPSGRLFAKMLAAIEALPTPPEVARDGVADDETVTVDHDGTVADPGAGVSGEGAENPAPARLQGEAA